MAHLRIEDAGDRVVVLTLDDPARRNALSLGLSEEIASAMTAIADDPDVGAVVITGAGRAFCAGADLSQLGESRESGLREIYDGFLSVAACPIPTIAAVNGAAVGAGMNLALACDLRVAGPQARFDCRFLELGIHPGGGHTWMLRDLLGAQGAAAMVLFGEILDPVRATEVGLVWEHTTDEDDLRERCLELARRAASAPRDLSTDTKSTLATMRSVDAHGDAVEIELTKQVASMDSPEFAERLAAMRTRIRAD